jgi:hypothetical protein
MGLLAGLRMARKEAKTKRLATGTITKRRMRRVHRPMAGWASGHLYHAASPEVLLSEGSVYINGTSGSNARHYVLTPTRLLWAPHRCALNEAPEVGGFSLNEVTFFDFDRQGPNIRHFSVLVGGRTFTLGFIPYGVAGPRLRVAEDDVFLYLRGAMMAAGAQDMPKGGW